MFPLDVLSQAVPAQRVAGRFGIDIFGFLWPKRAASGDEGLRLYAYNDVTGPLDIDKILAQTAPPLVSRASLQDHMLIIRPPGEFFSTDELELSQVERTNDQWSIVLEITHCESQDIDPSPSDLCVVLGFDAGNHRLQSLTLKFSGRQRDFQGNETTLAEPVAPLQVILFSE